MSENSREKESLLLVDDNPTNLQVLYQTLENTGCKLLVAKNGETALSIAQKASPDLILLDIMMPGIDGFEVCRRLKADPATADIPVIFLSALTDTKDKVQGLQLGAVDYVSKPFQPDEVIARVDTHLTIHRLKREVEEKKDALEDELEAASDVQRRLLPKNLPEIAGLKLAVHYETSLYAGGDYYDIAKMADDQWGFLVADAEGHSAPAAVMMAMTCALFRSYPHPPADPGGLLYFLNEHMCKVADPSFVTALYVVYDAASRTLKIARAGHPPPMIYRSAEKKASEYKCGGVFPLGIDPYERVPVTEAELHPGDRILMYTDGITERFNTDGETYGEERLLRQLEAGGDLQPQELLTAIMQDVNAFANGRPADDDQALLLGIVR
ncbi:MAG: SpoIIE family protein phosphatase [Deltaproteobacteria bacterium]|jgi:sigma-B regulation protein RsbU (phosphoserine phosphatase)|nr:SpoIIE family protein phosphatase [Deltaproteobacteria bacterium]